MTAEISQTLDRGLRLLEIVVEQPGGLGIGELAERLGVGRTVVYRLVATLEAHALVRRDGEGRVRLGLGVLTLTQASEPLLRQLALPVLHELADVVGATAHLTRAEGDDGVAVAVVEPRWTDYHVGYREGARHPLTKGASGRAILAGRTDEAAAVRSSGELQAGAHGVAAPVLGFPGMELSIGVVSLAPLDHTAELAVLNAAATLQQLGRSELQD